MPPINVAILFARGHLARKSSIVEVPYGTTVTLTVTSDVVDEVHLRGYERSVPTTPEAPGVLQFTADRLGQYPADLELRAINLIEFVVVPADP
jgi:hypothetical protein